MDDQTPDPFTEAEQANRRGMVRAALDQLARSREMGRDMQPMPAGSLFDDVTRAQADLFGERG